MYKSIIVYTVGLLAMAGMTTATYSADLKCGKCIKEGYNFCFVGSDTQEFDKESPPETTCCEDTSCAQASNSSWTCSGSYSDTDYAKTFCPFKKDKCGSNAEVTFENNVNETQQITVQNMSQGETCSFKIKSKCHSPGFKKLSSDGMNDSNTEVSFIEYKKSFVNATEKDGSGESFEGKKTKMPSDDKPPRNQSWSDLGKQNATNCTYNYSVGSNDTVTDYALTMQGKAKVSVTLESNGTYTVETCFKMQYKPRRKKSDGSYTEKESMDNATKEYWKEKKGEKSDGPSDKTSTADGGDDTKDKKQKREKDSDGWDGKSINEDKTDWGKSVNDTQYEADPTEDKAEEGYGKPSKGTYSTELGGYKSFGTVGQGESNLGVKDTNDTTCGDRVVLLSITALEDNSVSDSTTSSSSHPVVMQSLTPYLTMEVGSYQFYDDLEAQVLSTEESAFMLKASWMLASLASLFVMASAM